MLEFKVDDVNLIDIDWKSPLQLKINDICEDIGRATAKAFDDMVFGAVAEVGIEVDRDELIRALAYDRGQYEKGFVDGYRAAKNEIVRCKDCKWWKDEICTNVNGAYKNLIFNPNWHCASGERKDDDTIDCETDG